ncbi:MAG: PCYCGC motif-containing (lipo)protein [Candidatus Hydrothermarchaeales archaeon]
MEDEESAKKEDKTEAEASNKENIKSDGFQTYLERMGVTRVLIWGLVIGLIVGGIVAYNFRPNTATQTLSKEELKEKTKNYILANMVRPETSVVINNITEEKGLYKLEISLAFQGQTQDVETYATKDGELFFPTALDMSITPVESPPTTTHPAPTTTTPPQIQISATSLVDDDPSKGPENAPVTIVEFSDFQCPFCASASSTVHKIIDTYGDKVRVVYRDFPLSSIHPHAQKAAEAAECADEQGKFWEFHDMIFANQGNMDVDNLKQFAKDLGLDSKKFDECLDSGKYEAEVKNDMQDGIDAGVTSTPTFFVNDEKVVGAKPFSTFQLVIEAKLNSGSGSTLPAYTQTNAVTAQAYTISTEIPGILEKIPCYCSCGVIGHDSLKECFLSENGEFVDHASYCDVCINEALDVDRWYKEGVSIEEIRSRIDEKYKQYGEPTDTPL